MNGSTLRSRRDELVPLRDHVAILVHDRVPAGDLAHTFCESAAVADRAGFLHDLAVGRENIARGRLALHPEAPLVRRHERLGGVERGGVVALPVKIGADPAGEVPVDVLVGGVEGWAGEMLGEAEATAPGAIAFG